MYFHHKQLMQILIDLLYDLFNRIVIYCFIFLQELEKEMATLQDIDISPPENEAGDDFLFPDDLEDLDSDLENDLLEDSISIVSTPKPSLRLT